MFLTIIDVLQQYAARLLFLPSRPMLGPAARKTIPECQDCSASVDVVIRTPTGKHFGTHSTNLDLYSEGFPPVEFAGGKVNMVDLPESEDVVELMLMYMHKQRQPEIRKVKFKVLKGLAEAVEKYIVYSAMEVVNMRMQEYYPRYPLDVLSYAMKHDYPELCDLCAHLTLGTSMKIVQLTLGPANAFKWAMYREGFLDIIRTHTPPNPTTHTIQYQQGLYNCGVWKDTDIQNTVMKRMLAGPDCLLSGTWKKEMVAIVGGCSECKKRVTTWIEGMQRSADDLPQLSSLLLAL